MTATNSAFCNTSHNTHGSGKRMYKKILRNYLLPHLPLRRFVGLLNNQTLQKCSLIHLVFTILAILTSFKSKSSRNNYLLSWKHMNYTFMPFSMYMFFFYNAVKEIYQSLQFMSWNKCYLLQFNYLSTADGQIWF